MDIWTVVFGERKALAADLKLTGEGVATLQARP